MSDDAPGSGGDAPAKTPAPKDGLGKIKAVLGKKLGPLPVGIWAGAIVGGLLIGWMIRRNGGSTESGDITEEPNAQAIEDAAADYALQSGWDEPDPGGTRPGAGPTTNPTTDGSYPETPTRPAPAPTRQPVKGNGGPTVTQKNVVGARGARTNAEWGVYAVAAMKARGFQTAKVNAAITDYLNHGDFKPANAAVMAVVISVAGPPPVPPKRRPRVPTVTKQVRQQAVRRAGTPQKKRAFGIKKTQPPKKK